MVVEVLAVEVVHQYQQCWGLLAATFSPKILLPSTSTEISFFLSTSPFFLSLSFTVDPHIEYTMSTEDDRDQFLMKRALKVVL
jgi:hypothetical protein